MLGNILPCQFWQQGQRSYQFDRLTRQTPTYLALGQSDRSLNLQLSLN